MATENRFIDLYSEVEPCNYHKSDMITIQVRGIPEYNMENGNNNIKLNNCNKFNFNYGLACLRIWMCFEVILNHLWTYQENEKIFWIFIKMKPVAVPVFMLISFFFMEPHFLNSTRESRKKRMWRIIYPQLGWAIIYFVIYRLDDLILDTNHVYRIEDLLLQICFGHSINQTMWFQFDLIVLTFLFFLIFKHFSKDNKVAIKILFVLLLLSLFLQYTGLSYSLISHLRPELSYPIGRIFEVLPYAVIGFYLAYFRVLDKLESKIKIVIPTLLIIMLLNLWKNILPTITGFGYSGFSLLITAVCLTTIAYIIRFPQFIQKNNCIKYVTKYTLGIYCMHRLVGNICEELFTILGVPVGNFLYCIMIYICCYIISAVIARIPYMRGLVS